TDPVASIVIRTYNEEEHLERLLLGVRNQLVPFDYEIVVVDSGSTDATVAIAMRHGARLIHITPEEFSFGFSLNKGIENSRGEFCVFISGHCYPVQREWLANLIAPFSDPAVALVYGKQRGTDTTKYSEHQIFQRWFGDGGKGRQDSVFCNNANAAIRKERWRECRFNETITGLEDIDWAKKVVERGHFIFYAPDAAVIHVHKESYRQIFRRYEREALALRGIYPHDSFSLLDFLKLYLLNVLSDCFHAFKEGVFLKSCAGVLAMRLFQFWGTYKGHNYRDAVSQGLRYKFYYPKKPEMYKRLEIVRNATAAGKQDL
ncbi:glycosyltransferase, partial [Geomonas sp.]|uniref:glycosyltransferase n=1 Tax=Geomonas sp. TaxID=2651584 RepID=UPI002B45EAE7